MVPAMTMLSSALYNASLAAKQATLGEPVGGGGGRDGAETV